MIVLRLLAALALLAACAPATDTTTTPASGYAAIGVTSTGCTLLRDEAGHHATRCPEPGAAGAAHVWGREGRR